MDLERLKKLHTARSSFVEAANSDLPTPEKGQTGQLKERFITLADRMTKYVTHEHYDPDESGQRYQHSAARLIGRFEGPMPNVYVRFKYTYELGNDWPFSVRGPGFNEYDENIRHLIVEFSHKSEEVDAEPSKGNVRVPVITGYGETFATETISFGDLNLLEDKKMDQTGMEYLYESHPSVWLTLMEQAMDQYEAAPPSPYEIREKLVEA